MLDPLSQRQKSSAYNAEGDEIVPGRSLIIMENRTGLRTLPWGVPFSERFMVERHDSIRT